MTDPGNILMPWGKYRDRQIGSVPSSYLRYVAEQWTEDTPLKKVIVKACDQEWQFREKTGCHFEDDQ
jgi:hypothetical protein